MKQLFILCADYLVSFYSPARRRKIAAEICGDVPRFLPGGILHAVRKRFGFGPMVLSDLILFGWCAAAGFLISMIPPDAMLLRDCLGIFCCLIAFAMCWDDEPRTILKASFVCVAMLERMPWSAIVLILIAFEHLVSHPSEKAEVSRQ